VVINIGNISKNFSFSEFGKLDNELERLAVRYMVEEILQPVRDKFGVIRITSGKRTEAENKRVGGVPRSLHLVAHACDFIPLYANIDDVFRFILNQNLPYRKLILETKLSDRGLTRWLHISIQHPEATQVHESYLAQIENGETVYCPALIV